MRPTLIFLGLIFGLTGCDIPPKPGHPGFMAYMQAKSLEQRNEKIAARLAPFQQRIAAFPDTADGLAESRDFVRKVWAELGSPTGWRNNKHWLDFKEQVASKRLTQAHRARPDLLRIAEQWRYEGDTPNPIFAHFNRVHERGGRSRWEATPIVDEMLGLMRDELQAQHAAAQLAADLKD
ncbi:MAG: hypothetical protein AAF086_09715, partial [Planctomycetota bacterium]